MFEKFIVEVINTGNELIEFEVSAQSIEMAKKRVLSWLDGNFQADSFGYRVGEVYAL